jgi:hypothetical protein
MHLVETLFRSLWIVASNCWPLFGLIVAMAIARRIVIRVNRIKR